MEERGQGGGARPAAASGGAPRKNPDAPAAPRRRPASAAEGDGDLPGPGGKSRTAVPPRPSAPPPGRESEPRPEPQMTPNLWGPDAAIMKQPSVVEKDLADESLRKPKQRFSHKTMVAIYIACAIAVIASVVALVAFLAPPQWGIVPQ